MNAPRETFSSRWVMLLVMLGMAVGTGNIRLVQGQWERSFK